VYIVTYKGWYKQDKCIADIQIFSTGRSLNFIRYSCHDAEWIETQVKLANSGRALKYSDLAGLERSIDDAYSLASDRLLETFYDKFKLMSHLQALKAYLLLGAGDFAELLMESIAYVVVALHMCPAVKADPTVLGCLNPPSACIGITSPLTSSPPFAVQTRNTTRPTFCDGWTHVYSIFSTASWAGIASR
jgi:hypothetical protein